MITPHTVTFTAENEDDDVGQIFVNKLEEVIKQIYNQTKFAKKILYTYIHQKNFISAAVCHICEGELNEDRVRDHCHLTGKYRGAAHNDCNLNYRIPKFIPVYLHNLSGFDCHLFINWFLNRFWNMSKYPIRKFVHFLSHGIVSVFCHRF